MTTAITTKTLRFDSNNNNNNNKQTYMKHPMRQIYQLPVIHVKQYLQYNNTDFSKGRITAEQQQHGQ